MVRGLNERADPAAAERRAAEALLDGAERRRAAAEAEGDEVEIDATLTFSADERLKAMDFEQMSAAELAAARRAIARLELPVRRIASRRTRVDPRGRVADWRGTMRAALRSGGDVRGAGACAPAAPAGRTSWCSATSRGRCRPTAGCCCISCTPPPTPRGRAGRRCMPSPSARG